MLIRDFPADGVLIPFTNLQMNMTVIALSQLLASFMAGFVILYALVKQPQIPMDSQFIISLIAADLCFTSFELIIGSWISKCGFVSLSRS